MYHIEFFIWIISYSVSESDCFRQQVLAPSIKAKLFSQYFLSNVVDLTFFTSSSYFYKLIEIELKKIIGFDSLEMSVSHLDDLTYVGWYLL